MADTSINPMTHEDRLRREMTVAREVWREDKPVATLGEGQNAADFRDQQHTAAWGEARFLVSGKESDAVAVRVASELATEGRGMTARDTGQLAEAITTIYGQEKAAMGVGDSFKDRMDRAIAGAGPGVNAVEGDPLIDHVVGRGASNSPETASKLEEIAAATKEWSTGYAIADTPDYALGSSRSKSGEISWQIIDVGTGEVPDHRTHEDAKSALASMRKLSGLGITYEGIDASEHEESWLKSLHMPGDKVRFDSEAKVSGIDPHDTMDALGTEPLTVSKAIARGVETPNGMGGTRTAVMLEYEFEGKEGRHNAKQFMEEGGREHMYGVMLVRDDRMWAVPLVEDEVKRDGTMVVDGPAREVVGFAGKDRDELDPGGFPGMKDYVREENGAAGEFYVQPRDGYGSPGPVNILNIPWQSGVSFEEMGLAMGQIDKAIAKETREREDPVGVLVEAMESTSRVWRFERERVDFTKDQTVPVTDLANAERLSRDEANRLLKGRDVNDPNVRMAAAIVATEGRETTTGSLDSRRLADGLLDAPTAAGRSAVRAGGLLSQAAGLKGAGRPVASKGIEADDLATAAATMQLGGQGR
jgi:hypothetical protein